MGGSWYVLDYGYGAGWQSNRDAIASTGLGWVVTVFFEGELICHGNGNVLASFYRHVFPFQRIRMVKRGQALSITSTKKTVQAQRQANQHVVVSPRSMLLIFPPVMMPYDAQRMENHIAQH